MRLGLDHACDREAGKLRSGIMDRFKIPTTALNPLNLDYDGILALAKFFTATSTNASAAPFTFKVASRERSGEQRGIEAELTAKALEGKYRFFSTVPWF